MQDEDSTLEDGPGKLSRTDLNKLNQPSKTITNCHCGNGVITAPLAGIPCFVCNAYTHFRCAGIPEKIGEKLRKFGNAILSKKIKLYYLCKKCVAMKDQIKPSGYPTDDELKSKLKHNNKE